MEKRNWNNFRKRVAAQYPLLESLGVSYGKESESSLHMIRYFLRDVTDHVQDIER